jgi:hypothetical protein
MEIKDGDIFRWSYKDEQPEHRREWGRYHCKSCIAVAKAGMLHDTYWHYSPEKVGGGMDGARWTYDEAVDRIHLEPVGNLAELEKKEEWHAAYYDDADCVNLNHSNSSRNNFYIRKGAQRSREKMLAVLAERIRQSESEISFRESRLERDRQLQADLESGRDLADVYL